MPSSLANWTRPQQPPHNDMTTQSSTMLALPTSRRSGTANAQRWHCPQQQLHRHDAMQLRPCFMEIWPASTHGQQHE